MIRDLTTIRWHAAIIRDAERGLGRRVTKEEKAFVTSRGGFVALEMIHDEVKSLKANPEALAKYLNSESESRHEKKAQPVAGDQSNPQSLVQGMKDEDRGTFTLSDIRAIRYLILVLGGIATFMLLVTDRESPLMVVGFISIVTVVPLATIYLLRIAKGKKPNQAPRAKTPAAVTPRAK
jgi:hypothetical protein